MKADVIPMLERMAENGTAPKEGCSLFGVGYEETFQRLKSVYLEDRFARGGSAEKFVVGPFGSGKTHFVRQLMEIAREMDCATAEVALNKDVDFVQNLVVYREVAREIRPPGSESTGIQSVLLAAMNRVRERAPKGAEEKLLSAWVAGLDHTDFKLASYGRMTRRAIEAHLRKEAATFDACCRWLEGDVDDRVLARELSVSPVSKSEHNLHAKRAMLSLFQFIRRAGFKGTVVAYDEAEQGLTVDRRKTQRILSMLQSDINALADLEKGAALVVYALTPDLVERMEEFPALGQRVADPAPDRGFFDRNTLAPKIDLTHRSTDAVEELRTMGCRLVGLLYNGQPDKLHIERTIVEERIATLAREIAESEASAGNRRTMMKRTSEMLLRLYEDGVLEDEPRRTSAEEAEV